MKRIKKSKWPCLTPPGCHTDDKTWVYWLSGRYLSLLYFFLGKFNRISPVGVNSAAGTEHCFFKKRNVTFINTAIVDNGKKGLAYKCES